MRLSTLTVLALTLLAACGGDEAPAEKPAETPAAEAPAADAPAADAHAGHDMAAHGDITKPVAPEGSKVMFGEPADGATVKSPLKVVFQVEGLTVKPAGTMEAGTGHHHLIIDDKAPAAGTAVAADDTHIHYGKGQTETEIELAPGKHTLTMQFANGAHISYGEQLSTTITVTVEE